MQDRYFPIGPMNRATFLHQWFSTLDGRQLEVVNEFKWLAIIVQSSFQAVHILIKRCIWYSFFHIHGPILYLLTVNNVQKFYLRGSWSVSASNHIDKLSGSLVWDYLAFYAFLYYCMVSGFRVMRVCPSACTSLEGCILFNLACCAALRYLSHLWL